VRSGAAAMLDQLDYAQGFVRGGRCSVADPNADLNYSFTAETSVDGSADSPHAALRGNFHQLMELKHLYPHLKILISLEGRASDFAADASPGMRASFVASCVKLFLRGNFGPKASAPGLFDGFDIDWEYPRGADGANYVPLLAEFRRQMDALRPGFLLSVALATSPSKYGNADIAAVGRIVDLAGLMTYDFSGPWSRTTGFIAPLSSSLPDAASVKDSVNAWKDAGIPAAKLLIGLPFYAYGWRNVSNLNGGLGQAGRPVQEDQPYSFIESLIGPLSGADPIGDSALSGKAADLPAKAPSGRLLYRDPMSKAPWLLDGSSFWTYDDPVSIRSKAAFAREQQLAGMMVWELSEDTATATLLNAAHSGLVEAQSDVSSAGSQIAPTP